jgi:hypothetical protein
MHGELIYLSREHDISSIYNFNSLAWNKELEEDDQFTEEKLLMLVKTL